MFRYILEYTLLSRGIKCAEDTKYFITNRNRCDGWPNMSLEDCKLKCSKNEIPNECNGNPNNSSFCKYVIWDANPYFPPGWCQLADRPCKASNVMAPRYGGTTEIWKKQTKTFGNIITHKHN